MKRSKPFVFFVILIGSALFLIGCGAPTPKPTEIPATVGAPDDGSGYPDPVSTAVGGSYPAAANENLLAEPPNPERALPEAASGTGVVGGVLVREISGEGFLPLTPRSLFLGEVINNSRGEAALIGRGSDSPAAQLFPTGIFIFNNVPPGDYGLVIDVGFSEFPVTTAEGEQMIITVTAGQALDLGQVFVTLPN